MLLDLLSVQYNVFNIPCCIR